MSPHPDDETLGAGGTILKLKSQGHQVYWMNVTSMEGLDKYTKEQKITRQRQLANIRDFYGFSFEEVHDLGMATAELEQVKAGAAIEQIADIFKKVEPEMLILPDPNDAHSDHKHVFDWCFACSKVFRFPHIKQILTMEILSETDFGKPDHPFVPNYFVDITNFMDKKIEALYIYDTELGVHPFPRSEENVKALATMRGAAAGVRYAEGFRLLKYIVK